MKSIAQFFVPIAAIVLRNLNTHRRRKRFAKIIGPYFDGCVARTAYGFPMIAYWHDNVNRIGFEGSHGIVADFIMEMPSDSLFIDIGANQGFTSILASKVLSSGSVIAYEPSESSFKIFNKNIAINRCGNIVAINKAVSSEHKEVYLNESDGENTGAYHISKTGKKVLSEPIRIKDVDEISKYPRIFVKIDTEGHELQVLKGIEELLSYGLINSLVIEINDQHLARFGDSPEELYKFLEKYGFFPKTNMKSDHYDEIFTKKQSAE